MYKEENSLEEPKELVEFVSQHYPDNIGRVNAFWDAIVKIESGRICLEKDFDLKMSATLQKLVKEHDIKYDPENPIPDDDTLADDVYQAALELYLETGTYIVEKRRVIKFSEEEVKNLLKTCPAEVTFGAGKYASKLTPRKIEDTKPPFCMFGAGSPVSEDIYLEVLQSYAKEPLADTFSGGIWLNTVGGKTPSKNSPLEVYAAVLNAILVRKAATKVGKPEIGIHNVVGSATSTA
ncbi:MAG TPA: monomethylamine:corrinoid methyltransferase, partial [Candidatus Bathyarchaeota archaeon]|nr:monomethylamine:corrinoid methyltransferase [Candidatus Bathyarchaeota archaeon]HEX68910.1 monomethylamine:corrinoid methyltransferase [Candidatus Bathyarchaeota archaeon]